MKLSESEWQIMNALWSGHPATARDLAERFPDEVTWAYTTIKTMLSRLVAKGAVAESKRGNTSVYEPLVSRRRARRGSWRPSTVPTPRCSCAPWGPRRCRCFASRRNSMVPAPR